MSCVQQKTSCVLPTVPFSWMIWRIIQLSYAPQRNRTVANFHSLLDVSFENCTFAKGWNFGKGNVNLWNWLCIDKGCDPAKGSDSGGECDSSEIMQLRDWLNLCKRYTFVTGSSSGGKIYNSAVDGALAKGVPFQKHSNLVKSCNRTEKLQLWQWWCFGQRFTGSKRIQIWWTIQLRQQCDSGIGCVFANDAPFRKHMILVEIQL